MYVSEISAANSYTLCLTIMKDDSHKNNDCITSSAIIVITSYSNTILYCFNTLFYSLNLKLSIISTVQLNASFD